MDGRSEEKLGEGKEWKWKVYRLPISDDDSFD